METISNTLFWISNGLSVPVIVLLLLFFLRAIILAGGFFDEFYQRMKLQKQFTEMLEYITTANIDIHLQELLPAGKSPFSVAWRNCPDIVTMQPIVSAYLPTTR